MTLDPKQLITDHYNAKAAEDERKFPVRGSALADCPRKLASLLRHVEADQLSARTMRIFEVGHSRGQKLAEAMAGRLKKERPDAIVEMERVEYIPLGITGADAFKVYGKALREWGPDTADIPLDVRVGELSLAEHLASGGALKDVPQALMLEGRLYVIGHSDITVTEESGDDGVTEGHVVDFKTASSYAFRKARSGDVGERYEVQVLGYGASMEDQGVRLASASLLFEDKDTSQLHSHVVELTEENASLFAEHKGNVEALLMAWANNQPATASPAIYAEGVVGPLPWPCNYCAVGPIRGRCTERQVVDSPKSTGGPHRWVAK